MKIMKLIICLAVAASLLGGCGFKRKSKEGSYIGTDTPLQEYPLDKFAEPMGVDAAIFRDVHFDYDKYAIKSEDISTLEGIAEWLLRAGKSTHLLIEGHCDERGSNEYNLALGEQRALAVRQFLVNKGINAFQIQTISYGEERPLDPEHGENAWRENRRGHFMISNG
ncbi:MAG: OmpA family protein [Candidatus Aureabacteria bacterium]|nr:OmpA family protein [Candidatus Auribacterota bacterium]